jgi:hypothetical protein
MPSGKKAKEQRKAPPPAVRSTSGGGGSRRTLWIVVAAIVVVAAVGIGLGVALSGGGSGSSSGPVVDFSKLAGLQTGPPPWNNGITYLQQNLPYLQLNPLTAEGTALHIHQHLDVFVDGKHVTVPAEIGIFGNQFITEVHTHDTSGVIHVESPTIKTFSLGQFFGEWTVLLNQNCLGRYCGNLHWYVNGKAQTGNPATLALSQHQEIVIAVGKLPANIPSTFDFAALGL